MAREGAFVFRTSAPRGGERNVKPAALRTIQEAATAPGKHVVTVAELAHGGVAPL